MTIIKLILKDLRSGQTHLVKDQTTSFLTPSGTISKEQLQNESITIVEAKDSKGKITKFAKFKPTFADLKENLLRAPQIMQDKDIGLIIAKTGINKDSVVIDAGAGSGALTLSLANITKHVTSFDSNKDHLKVVQKNAKLTGLNNLTLTHGDVTKQLQSINQNSIDLITLDLPRPWEALTSAANVLKQGAHLVIYLPNIVQVQRALSQLQEVKNLQLQEMTEIQKRDWKVQIQSKEAILRPEHTQNVHTGFLLFIRKF